jgi:hypothetical protein
MAGEMLLDAEEQLPSLARRNLAFRLRRLREIALAFVFFESQWSENLKFKSADLRFKITN